MDAGTELLKINPLLRKKPRQESKSKDKIFNNNTFSNRVIDISLGFFSFNSSGSGSNNRDSGIKSK